MPCYAIGDARPSLGGGVWLAPSADIIGDARLGDNVNVWFGAVIRADNTPIFVGARTNVQDGAMLHSDPEAPLTVGEGVTIGHHAILHGCTIGSNVLIGMGSTVLNGSVIGDDCLVGAGALVTEGKTFPPRSLIIGVPAKMVRELDGGAIEALRVSERIYVEKAQGYAAGLQRLHEVPASSR